MLFFGVDVFGGPTGIIQAGAVMAKCVRCGKGPSFGQNRPFSLKATNRRFDPNVQKVSLFVDGRRQRVTLCTRCMRTLTRP